MKWKRKNESKKSRYFTLTLLCTFFEPSYSSGRFHQLSTITSNNKSQSVKKKLFGWTTSFFSGSLEPPVSDARHTEFVNSDPGALNKKSPLNFGDIKGSHSRHRILRQGRRSHLSCPGLYSISLHVLFTGGGRSINIQSPTSPRVDVTRPYTPKPTKSINAFSYKKDTKEF